MMPEMPPAKSDLLADLCARLTEELSKMVVAQRQTAQGVVHEESRAENDKDTRGLEASYLARGQAERVVELQRDLAMLRAMLLRAFEPTDPIALGAFVVLEGDRGERRYFVAPAGGGHCIEVDGHPVRVVSASSPVGRTLIGKRVGDDVEVRTPQGTTSWSVVAVE
jgi:transcription elongation GreA/GreB family factor